ncbi:MAG: helix-turn-helix transcriptional regulator [Christensenellales bacterium]|jgi:putative transcriptional regulator
MKNRLEELRKQRAIRQEDLAQALGVSRQTVISLEKGKYNPSLALAFKLARYFGLPIEAIFDDSDESTDATLPQ